MKDEELIEIANHARKNAFVPLSDYCVGAALLTKSKTVYIGANIELPSAIGISNCAERVAIQGAYAHGEREFEKIAIVGGKKDGKIDKTLTPCAVCLQFILEMCKDVDILCFIDGELVCKKVTDFLSNPYEYHKE